MCASADQKNILRAQGRTTLCSFLCTAISTNFFSLSILSFFAYSLIYFRFFFCFYTRYQKARLLSPTTTGALPYRLEHSLTLQEKLVRTSSGEVKIKYAAWHTQTHTHTHTYILRTSWGFAVVLVGEGGDEWGGGATMEIIIMMTHVDKHVEGKKGRDQGHDEKRSAYVHVALLVVSSMRRETRRGSVAAAVVRTFPPLS